MKEKLDSWRSFVKKIPLQGLLCLFVLSLSLPLSAQTEARKVTINVSVEKTQLSSGVFYSRNRCLYQKGDTRYEKSASRRGVGCRIEGYGFVLQGGRKRYHYQEGSKRREYSGSGISDGCGWRTITRSSGVYYGQFDRYFNECYRTF